MERYLTAFNTSVLPETQVETVIIGAGIAGLSTALQLSKLGIKPLIITKKPVSTSNSFLAQGGIAAAIGADDSPELHYADTIRAGRGLCNPSNVRILVEEGLERVVDLINWGVPFDRDRNGNILLTKEGAHTKRRVLHVKDRTGTAIGSVLYNLVKDKVQIETDFYLEEILTEDNRYAGIVVCNKKEKRLIRSKSLVIATGGYSAIYYRNTSAYKISGDTISAAFRAGCTLEDLEFVQFHPTALNIEGEPAYLLTEALRGEGAILIDENGNRFINELRPRDEVARAIFRKYREGHRVYLNLNPVVEKGIDLKERFPTIYSLIEKYNLKKDLLIPVSPAAHYSIGGIKATVNGKTSVEGIFTVGESSCTEIHGANRLASNSLLECVTFGYKTAYAVYVYNMYSKIKNISVISNRKTDRVLSKNEKDFYLKKIKKTMWDYVGLERSEESLNKALQEISDIEERLLKFSNARYLLDLTYLSKGIILSALNRKESRGTHYRLDYPEEKEDYKKHTKIYNNFKIKMEVN